MKLTKKLLLLCFMALMIFALITGCNDKKNPTESTTTTTSTTTTQNTDPPTMLDGKDVIKYQKDGDKVKVNITLADASGCYVSLIALSNPDDRFSWSNEGKDSLSDLAQVKLDKDGKGEATLVLSSQSEKVFVILTAPDSSYVVEIV